MKLEMREGTGKEEVEETLMVVTVVAIATTETNQPLSIMKFMAVLPVL